MAPRVRASLEEAGFEVILLTVPPGEEAKSFSQAESLCERMARAGLDRSSFLVAVGGGVVGDLGGFVASIYHRGIPWINLPTTLLAQVDSAIGGKTAVNLAAGKNLAGAVHQPSLVLSDTETLATLPPRQLSQGFAEIIKHAIIADSSLLDDLERLDRTNLAPLIRRNVEIKAAHVATDAEDLHGRRALLNFGHTIGHAVEAAGDYRELLHGEAVSLGIVAACNISHECAGFPRPEQARVTAALSSFGLPVKLPTNLSRDKIRAALRRDKKFENGQVRFVVTPGLGSARLSSDVSLARLEAAIDSL